MCSALNVSRWTKSFLHSEFFVFSVEFEAFRSYFPNFSHLQPQLFNVLFHPFDLQSKLFTKTRPGVQKLLKKHSKKCGLIKNKLSKLLFSSFSEFWRRKKQSLMDEEIPLDFSCGRTCLLLAAESILDDKQLFTDTGWFSSKSSRWHLIICQSVWWFNQTFSDQSHNNKKKDSLNFCYGDHNKSSFLRSLLFLFCSTDYNGEWNKIIFFFFVFFLDLMILHYETSAVLQRGKNTFLLLFESDEWKLLYLI